MAETAANSRLAIDLDEGATADLAEMFRLLGDGTRLAIVIACLDRPRAVAAIAERTGGTSRRGTGWGGRGTRSTSCPRPSPRC